MKNPFIKEKSNSLWIAIALGALAAGVVNYFVINKTETGDKLSDATEEVQEQAADYLKAKTAKLKKHKSDIHELEQLTHHLE